MGRTWDILLGLVSTVASLMAIGWVCWRMLHRSPQPWTMMVKTVSSLLLAAVSLWGASKLSIFGPFLIVLLGVVLSLVWTPHLAEWFSQPITGLFAGADEEPDARPLYSTAYAKRKRGQPVAAIAAVREQLAQYPNDFEGIILLAQIQAQDLTDLPGAHLTLMNFCRSPQAGERQIFAALTQLADWHLKLAVDVDAARAVWQEIITRFPETEMALIAQQRLAHLDTSAEMLLTHHDNQAVPVPEGVPNLGLREASAYPQPKEIAPGQLAAAHVKHLEQHPHDTEVREKLAMLYAQHFRRLDLATMELEQLINEPNQPARRVTHWLNQLATYQVDLGADVATVCGTLQRIVEKFPESPAAEMAGRRLNRVNLEIKGRATTSSVKLGEYDQRLGLKGGRPGKTGGKTPV